MNEIVLDASIQRPSIKDLTKFSTFEALPEKNLKRIAEHAELRQAKRRAVLMNIGEDNTQSIFLLKGNVLLEAADNRQRIIKHSDPSAREPLSRLRPSHYKITTLTPITYIRIDNRFLDELMNLEASSEVTSSHYVVEESSEDNLPFSTRIIAHVYEDLQKDQLRLYSWHPPALKISQGIIAEKADHSQIVQLAYLDPVLTLKLLKVYGQLMKKLTPKNTTLGSAIQAIGLKNTHKLVFMNLFRESSHPRTALMTELFRQSWERSIVVSKVAQKLAIENGHDKPHLAALGGLLHNIGDIAIIGYAYKSYRKATPQDITDCISHYSADINRMLLSHWGILPALAQATADSTDMMYDDANMKNSLTNLIIAAKAIVRTTQNDGPPLAPLPQIPAMRKLHLTQPSNKLLKELQQLAETSIEQTKQELNLK